MNISHKAEKLIATADKNKYIILTAESCTGGLLGAALTEVPGASKAYHGGFIVYDNDAKNQFIGVEESILAEHGAVSPECAEAMAEGTLKKYPTADVSLSITGIAGPGGGSVDKPVGLVYFGFSNKRTNKTYSYMKIFNGNRDAVRKQSVEFALDVLLEKVE